MTDQIVQTTARAQPVDKVVRQTYTLLGIVMAVAAAGAGIGLAMDIGWGIGMWLLFMVVFIGGPFAIDRAKTGDAAIWMTIAWGGLVGFLLSPLVNAYVYLFRGTPLLVQTYLIYYGLGQFEWIRDSWAWLFLRDAWWCALIAFSLFALVGAP